jgi:Tol biopolymer transport system component
MRSVSTLVVVLVMGGSTVAAASATHDRGASQAASRAHGILGTGAISNPVQSFDPAWSPDGRKIALVSNRAGSFEVYVMNADGGGKRRLTRHARVVARPVWSPDGRKIAFESLRHAGPRACSDQWPSAGCNWEVYVMNADGSGQRRLTRSPGLDRYAAWSPDGRKLLFHRARSTGGALRVMNADGSGQRRLGGGSPGSWSPDGQEIVFSRGGSDRDVYVMNADGSSQRNLTGNPARDGNPVWSPDGQKIAFLSDRDGNLEVYVMNADGGGQRNLTRNPAADRPAAWSPDGQKIAFTSDRDGNGEIYVMNADGSGQRNLTRTPGVDEYTFAWSPDGRKIAFVSVRDTNLSGLGNSEVYVMNADGSGQRRLTRRPGGTDISPAWSPGGRQTGRRSPSAASATATTTST